MTHTSSLLASLLLWITPGEWMATAADYQPYSPTASAAEVSAPLFVVLAYSLIWLVLLGFVVSVWWRQRRVAQELVQLRRQLQRGEP